MGFFDSIGSILGKVGGIIAAPATGGMSLWPSLISGGLGLVGSMMTNSANAAQASANRAFQANMSNTSYQRGVMDMRAAGLNPALAYSQGGASTPSGSQATMQNNIGSAVSSAMQAAQLQASIQNTSSDTRLKEAQAIQARAAAANSAADAAMKSPKAGLYGAVGRVVNPLLDAAANNANSAKASWGLLDRIRGFHVGD